MSHLYFFPEKPGDLFLAHRCHYHYRFYCFHSGVTPLEGVTPHLFYLSDLVSPLFFVNSPTKIKIPLGVTSPVLPGRGGGLTYAQGLMLRMGKMF